MVMEKFKIVWLPLAVAILFASLFLENVAHKPETENKLNNQNNGKNVFFIYGNEQIEEVNEYDLLETNENLVFYQASREQFKYLY